MPYGNNGHISRSLFLLSKNCLYDPCTAATALNYGFARAVNAENLSAKMKS